MAKGETGRAGLDSDSDSEGQCKDLRLRQAGNLSMVGKAWLVGQNSEKISPKDERKRGGGVMILYS